MISVTCMLESARSPTLEKSSAIVVPQLGSWESVLSWCFLDEEEEVEEEPGGEVVP